MWTLFVVILIGGQMHDIDIDKEYGRTKADEKACKEEAKRKTALMKGTTEAPMRIIYTCDKL